MDLVHKLMNIFAPPIAIAGLFCVLPSYLFSKFLKFLISILSLIFSENVAGKHLAYEYARRGAYLALAARRKNSLREVADRDLLLGSPRVIIVPTDVSKVVNLVNSAGVTSVSVFEEVADITKFIPVMASKAALISLYERLKVEFGSDISVTIVSPGLIESEITKGKFLTKEGRMEVDREMRDVEMSIIPVETTVSGAKAIVNSACHGDNYLAEPSWVRTTLFWKVFSPELLEWCSRWFLISGPAGSEKDAASKKILDLTGLKKYLCPDSIPSPEVKVD